MTLIVNNLCETLDMIATLIILLISAILFVSGKVRSDLVAICALLALQIGRAHV